MASATVFLDTNVVLDYLMRREPHYADVRKLMIAGRVGEVSLWMAASQMTDVVYIASDGGKAAAMPKLLERLRLLRTFLKVATVTADNVDAMLATSWPDPEDALLIDIALDLRVDAFITRDSEFMKQNLIPVMDCGGFFEWLEHERGIVYDEVTY